MRATLAVVVRRSVGRGIVGGLIRPSFGRSGPRKQILHYLGPVKIGEIERGPVNRGPVDQRPGPHGSGIIRVRNELHDKAGVVEVVKVARIVHDKRGIAVLRGIGLRGIQQMRLILTQPKPVNVATFKVRGIRRVIGVVHGVVDCEITNCRVFILDGSQHRRTDAVPEAHGQILAIRGGDDLLNGHGGKVDHGNGGSRVILGHTGHERFVAYDHRA